MLTVSTVSTVSTVIARCYLHLRWYFYHLIISWWLNRIIISFWQCYNDCVTTLRNSGNSIDLDEQAPGLLMSTSIILTFLTSYIWSHLLEGGCLWSLTIVGSIPEASMLSISVIKNSLIGYIYFFTNQRKMIRRDERKCVHCTAFGKHIWQRNQTLALDL